MSAPIRRGTARRLGLRRPRRQRWMMAHLPEPWRVGHFDSEAARRAVTAGMVSMAEATKSAAEYFAACRAEGGLP